jgi:hypothetical protein
MIGMIDDGVQVFVKTSSHFLTVQPSFEHPSALMVSRLMVCQKTDPVV